MYTHGEMASELIFYSNGYFQYVSPIIRADVLTRAEDRDGTPGRNAAYEQDGACSARTLLRRDKIESVIEGGETLLYGLWPVILSAAKDRGQARDPSLRSG